MRKKCSVGFSYVMIRSQVVVEGGYVCVVLVTARDAAVDQRVRTHVL